MYEYKVLKAKNAKEAETLMNEMANDGWRVASTSYWSMWWIYLIITFEREKKNDVHSH